MIVIKQGCGVPEEGETKKFTPKEPTIDRLLDAHHGERVRVLRVSFAKGSRTHWHKHWGHKSYSLPMAGEGFKRKASVYV